jgi:alginate production protein
MRLGSLSALLLSIFPAVGFAGEVERTASAHDVIVGHWLEVRGEMRDDGSFVASKAELGAPLRREVLIGEIESATGRGRYRLLGQTVSVDSETRVRGFETAAEIVGERVKVEGRWRTGSGLEAREISARGPGRERLAGRVEGVRTKGDAVVVEIMGILVTLPTLVELSVESLAAAAVAPVRTREEEADEVSEDDLFGDGIRLGERTALLGQLRLAHASEENFDLDQEDAEDRLDDDASVRLRLEWRPRRAVVVLEGRAQERYRDDEEDGTSTRNEFVLGETYALLLNPFGEGTDVQIGRQDFDDEREWIYDQNLDGVRVHSALGGLHLELSASTTLGEGRERDRESINWAGYLSGDVGVRELVAWVLHRDYDSLDESLTHVGVRALGEAHWLDLAYLTGDRQGVRVGAWGLDLGSTFQPEWAGPFSFTVAYAYGSGGGGDSQAGVFQQTGLQDNNGKFAGVTSFRYYGELVDPELSNLHIATVGFGARLASRSSLDLVMHYYRQDVARNRLGDAEVSQKLDGVHRDLGWEIDVVWGDRRWKSWDFEVVGAYFAPGEAFRDEDEALLAKLQARFRF